MENRDRLFRGKYYDPNMVKKSKREGYTPYVITGEYELLSMEEVLKQQKERGFKFRGEKWFFTNFDTIYFLSEHDLKKVKKLADNMAELKKLQDKKMKLMREMLMGLIYGRITGENIGLNKEAHKRFMSNESKNIKNFEDFNND